MVVAVGHYPVRVSGFGQQPAPIAEYLDVVLAATDRQERVVADYPANSDPAARGILGIDERDLLSRSECVGSSVWGHVWGQAGIRH